MAILRSDPDSEYLEYISNSSSTDASSIDSNSKDSITESKTNIYSYDEVPENTSWASTIPVQKGLYNPEYEKDNCGVGMYTALSPTFFFSSI